MSDRLGAGELDELLLLNALRQWRCLNAACGRLHSSPISRDVAWAWCPDCGASSERTHCVARKATLPCRTCMYSTVPCRDGCWAKMKSTMAGKTG